MDPGRNIVLFDGACNLCHKGVRFLLRHDERGAFSYAWLQSETGRKLGRAYGIDTITENSFVFISGGRAWLRSDAVLEVWRLLGGKWKWLYGLRHIPKPLRDAVYGFVARQRFRWFGRKDSCERLPEKYSDRFMD